MFIAYFSLCIRTTSCPLDIHYSCLTSVFLVCRVMLEGIWHRILIDRERKFHISVTASHAEWDAKFYSVNQSWVLSRPEWQKFSFSSSIMFLVVFLHVNVIFHHCAIMWKCMYVKAWLYPPLPDQVRLLALQKLSGGIIHENLKIWSKTEDECCLFCRNMVFPRNCHLLSNKDILVHQLISGPINCFARFKIQRHSMTPYF